MPLSTPYGTTIVYAGSITVVIAGSGDNHVNLPVGSHQASQKTMARLSKAKA